MRADLPRKPGGRRSFPSAAHVEVAVRDLRIAAAIGANDHEAGRLQGLDIGVRVLIAPPAEDELNQTFDYNRIAELASAIASRHVVLIETFADRLARGCLADPRVLAVEVTIDKSGALTNGIASTLVALSRESVENQIERIVK